MRVGVHPVFWWVKPDKENVFDKDIFFQDIYGIVKRVLETKSEIRKNSVKKKVRIGTCYKAKDNYDTLNRTDRMKKQGCGNTTEARRDAGRICLAD